MLAENGNRTLRAYHRASAIILGIYLAIHIANHGVGLTGQAQHMAFMHVARPLYRNHIIEPLLLTLFAWQIGSGGAIALQRWRGSRGKVVWLQVGSGLYLALFLSIHASAVLLGRSALHLDTDFRFAAAGFHVAGWPWFFWPYYSLAIFAMFSHIGCALYWILLRRHRPTAQLTLGFITTMGAILGLLICSALDGALYPVNIPAEYKLTYARD